jgi:hypothetical protein
MKKIGPVGAKRLKIAHLFFMALWIGGVASLLALYAAIDRIEFSNTYLGYRALRTVAWNVVGWGGMGSLVSGLLLSFLTQWGIFKHRWVTVKFFVVLAQILFGMFFIQSRILSNLALIEIEQAGALSDGNFLKHHGQIGWALTLQLAVYIFIIAISLLKPWSKGNLQHKDRRAPESTQESYVLANKTGRALGRFNCCQALFHDLGYHEIGKPFCGLF